MNLNDSNLMRELNTKTAGILLVGKLTNKQGGGQEYAMHKPETPGIIFCHFTRLAINRIHFNNRFG